VRVAVLMVLVSLLVVHGCGGGGGGGSGWSETTPPDGGTITALAAHPSDDRVRLAGTAGGLFRSDDRGLTWQRIAPEMVGCEITCLAFSPADPTRFFAGTRRQGLFRSTNGGGSFAAWNGDLPAGTPDRRVTALALDPSDRDRLYLALAGRGVYRSTNGGLHWVLKVLGLGATDVRDLAVDRRDTKRVWAATARGVFRSVNRGDAWSGLTVALDLTSVFPHPSVPGLALTAGPDGVWRSVDDGHQWTRFENGLRTSPQPGLGSGRLVTHDPSNPDDLYLAGTEGVWRARGGQNRWDEINTHLGVPRNRVVGSIVVIGQGILVGPALQAGVAGEGLFTSTSGGVSWSRAGAGIDAVTVRAVAVSSASADVVYVGTPGRVWWSADRGNTWFDASGDLTGRARSIRDLWVDPRDDRRVLAATDVGVFETRDRGGLWVPATGIGAANALAVHADNGIYGLVMAVGKAGVFRSRDGGAVFSLVASGPDLVGLTDVAVDPVEPAFVYAVRADRGVLVSRNQGAGFKPAGQGLPPDLGYVDVQLNANDSAQLLVSSRAGGVFRSTDSGVTWLPSSRGLPVPAAGRLCADLRVDASHRARVVVAVPGEGLYQSRDGGMRWGLIRSLGLREVFVLALAPRGSDRIYAGLADGLLYGR